MNGGMNEGEVPPHNTRLDGRATFDERPAPRLDERVAPERANWLLNRVQFGNRSLMSSGPDELWSRQ